MLFSAISITLDTVLYQLQTLLSLLGFGSCSAIYSIDVFVPENLIVVLEVCQCFIVFPLYIYVQNTQSNFASIPTLQQYPALQNFYYPLPFAIGPIQRGSIELNECPDSYYHKYICSSHASLFQTDLLFRFIFRTLNNSNSEGSHQSCSIFQIREASVTYQFPLVMLHDKAKWYNSQFPGLTIS